MLAASPRPPCWPAGVAAPRGHSLDPAPRRGGALLAGRVAAASLLASRPGVAVPRGLLAGRSPRAHWYNSKFQASTVPLVYPALYVILMFYN